MDPENSQKNSIDIIKTRKRHPGNSIVAKNKRKRYLLLLLHMIITMSNQFVLISLYFFLDIHLQLHQQNPIANITTTQAINVGH